MSKNKKGLPSVSNPNHSPTRGKSSVKNRAYIEGRNSSSHALRTIIRNFYSDRPYDDKSICRAVIVKNSLTMVEEKGMLDTFWSWLGIDPPKKVQKYRVRIIDDPRHYPLPVPAGNDSIETEFYPMVIDFRDGAPQLKIGAHVEVQFYDIASQWSSIPYLSSGWINGVLENPKYDRDLTDLFSNCVTPRPTKGGKQKTTVGKACRGVNFAPGRIWRAPPVPPAGTDKNKVNHPALPVAPGGITFLDPYLDKSTNMLDPAKKEDAVHELNKYVTSGVGMRAAGPHKGTDFRAKMGDSIFSVFDGTVERVKEQTEGFGWYIVIKHTQFTGDAFYTLYAHLKEPDATKWKAGTKVKKGEKIGVSGATGVIRPRGEEGAHLHFEVLYDLKFEGTTEALDPEAFFLMTGYVKR